MTAIPASQVQRAALDPAMDAIALNASQARLVFNPATPQADSIVELLVAMGDMVLRLARANGLEADCERRIAGWADGLVTALRDLERNQPGQTVSGRKLAAELREPLAILGDPHRTAELRDAVAALQRIFAATLPEALFAGAVTHHLGVRKTRTLRAAHEQWARRRAQREGRSAA